MKIGEFEKFLVDKIKVDNKVRWALLCRRHPAAHQVCSDSCAGHPFCTALCMHAFPTSIPRTGSASMLTGVLRCRRAGGQRDSHKGQDKGHRDNSEIHMSKR